MTLDRRSFLSACSRAGVASALFPGVLYTLATQSAQAQESDSTDQSKPPKITPEMIDQAAILAGIGPFTDEQKKMMIDGLVDRNGSMKAIRKLKLPNSVAPSFVFHPQPARGEVTHAHKNVQVLAPKAGTAPTGMIGWAADESATAPSNIEDLAFASVSHLASLLKLRKITSTDLTKLYLARLKRYDPKLHFVITLTEDRALAQAKKADEEIAAGKYRGPLHGIPWGAKDLLAVNGYPTTWGAGGFEHQSFDEDATVVQRLDEAGAVLVAKFTLGALAMGDKWFGGRTRNPWNPKQGSSGSSAGSASAVAAGCVAFALGSETLGSIASPSTRCGDSGLRPSFGLVPRTGAMALSWTMDKLGPICRTAEDCALVLGVIHGQDGKDTSVYPYANFLWNPAFDWRSLRVGYLKSDFDDPKPFKPDQAPATESAEDKKKREERNAYMQARSTRVAYDHKFQLAALDKLKSMGVNLIPVELPKLPYGAMVTMLECEAAAAFDDLTLSGRDKLLTEQSADDWPNSFRTARFFPAVEYIQAARARTLACRQVSALFEKVDIIVAPTESQQLVATNLTGHPALIVPNGFRGPDAPHPPKEDDGNDDNIGGPGTPVSITFLAGLYQDAKLAAFGRAYQEATDFHKQHPKLD
ncbi:amidase [Occallatibacter riparius]|uniref:Amidase n=1 Tax=Occallatibacter riparius TaxID=1002689 RepID=A0A9J7BUU8_9BACT|nr:amidase [Occallatibacter riparius]UWZ84694.1 amidase [Occallatibacter riparius]